MKISYPHGPKHDWERQAHLIRHGEIQTTVEDIPMLLEWLRDMNWPGAALISSHLKSFGEANLECVRKVLGSGDDVWIMWVLIEFGDAFGRNFWAKLIPELKQVAFKYDEDGAHIEALYILAKERLESRHLINIKTVEFKLNAKSTAENYKKIESVI